MAVFCIVRWSDHITKVAGASIFYTNDKQLLQYQDDKLKLENDTFINKKDGDC